MVSDPDDGADEFVPMVYLGACPKCGAELLGGYGLAGGGMGPYKLCASDACDYFEKKQDESDA